MKVIKFLNVIEPLFFRNILFLSLVLFGFFLNLSGRLELSPLALTSGDVPSYLLFPFDSLSGALSSHRTFGFSALLQGYILIDDDLRTLPIFLYILYSVSILLLFRNIVLCDIKPLAALSICLGLILNSSFISGLYSLTASTLISILLVLILSIIFRVSKVNNYFLLFVLSILTMLVYQTRPNLAPLIFLAPVWLFFVTYLIKNISLKSSALISFFYLSFNLVLLSLFLLIRLISVGEFGTASFSGTVLSGQAVSYLDEKNVYDLDETSQVIGVDILKRKSLISAPCNKKRNELTHLDRNNCGNVWIMIAWLSAISLIDNEEPFEKKELNIEPWKHKNLGSFFSRNNNDIDKVLGNFSFQVIKNNHKLAISRLLYTYNFAFKNFMKMLTQNIEFMMVFLLSILGWMFRFSLNKKHFQKSIIKSKEFGLFVVFSFITISYLLQVILISGAMMHFDYRYILGSSVFLMPLFILLGSLSFITELKKK